MSVEILLIPAAMAGLSAVMAGFSGLSAIFLDDHGQKACIVQTRLKHPRLLAEALRNVGAADVALIEEGVEANLDGGLGVRFARNADGILACRFESDIGDERATEIVRSIDAEYARLVQRDVRARVLSRAGELGMTVESEMVDENEDVTVVLTVGR